MGTPRLRRRATSAREGQAGWLARAGHCSPSPSTIKRLTWPEREFIRQIGEKLYGSDKISGRQTMDNWTVEMVEERLVDAAQVMRRLPPVRVPGLLQHLAHDGRGVCRSRRPATRADAAAAAVARPRSPEWRRRLAGCAGSKVRTPSSSGRARIARRGRRSAGSSGSPARQRIDDGSMG